MIDPKYISVIVQGAVNKVKTPQCLASIRKFLPEAKIILSTWEGTDVSNLDYDVLILNADPGFFYYSKRSDALPNNVNRQIVSTFAGLKCVKTRYVMKLRTDFCLTGSSFLKYFETQPNFNVDYRIFKHKILGCCFCTRNPRSKIDSLAYHPSDVAFFGLTEDVFKIFDIPLMTEKEAHWDSNNDWSNRYVPEQYIFLNCLRSLGKNPKCESVKDLSPENILETEQYFTSNFIFLNYKNFNLLPSKPVFFAKNGPYVFKSCYTQIDFVNLYNSLQNDNIKFSRIDKEKLLITTCIKMEKLSKIVARLVFSFIPISRVRKIYRPKLVDLLYRNLVRFL